MKPTHARRLLGGIGLRSARRHARAAEVVPRHRELHEPERHADRRCARTPRAIHTFAARIGTIVEPRNAPTLMPM